MSNEKREPTISITHLVKQVANEMIQENLATITEQVRKHLWPEGPDNRYEVWTTEEDTKLFDEFNTFCQVIGKSHGRTAGAIRCRLGQTFYKAG